VLAGGTAFGALLLSACGGGSSASPTTASSSTTQAASQSSASAQQLQNAYVAVVDKVRPSVVEITTDQGLGSGIVYDSKGDIVTNDHVVAGATRFSVTLYDGKQYPATLVGAFPPDDLAVVRVGNASGLVPAAFANSSQVHVGEIALAIGNPLGLQSSVTNGIVSATGRTVSEGGGPNPVTLPNTIQTSAPINPGNSGGALVDLNSEVIGIPTLAAQDPNLGSSAAGIGFAIASNTVKLIAPQLISQGKVTNSGRAELGVTVGTGYNREGNPAGAIVTGVVSGGPAANAGLQVGDVIVSVGGQRVTSTSDLVAVLAGASPGQTVKVTYLDQSGAQHTVDVTLGQLSGG
jgi:putative serine protease PepD